MKAVDARNFKKIPPVDLVTGLGIGLQITEAALPGLISIFSHIATAVGNGPRARRIKALEEQVKLQEQINRRLFDEIEKLKNEIP